MICVTRGLASQYQKLSRIPVSSADKKRGWFHEQSPLLFSRLCAPPPSHTPAFDLCVCSSGATPPCAAVHSHSLHTPSKTSSLGCVCGCADNMRFADSSISYRLVSLIQEVGRGPEGEEHSTQDQERRNTGGSRASRPFAWP